MDVVVLIPSYKPDQSLFTTLQSLKEVGFERFVIVDDGNRPEYQPLFEQAASSGCTILHHAVNMGKGRALRTGFNHILQTYPNAPGIVVCDADGQHDSQSVLRAAELQAQYPDAMILGAREFFKGNTPLPNLMGNTITRLVFWLLSGLSFGDTQCGLRCFPLSRLPLFMGTYGDRFEFENCMLLDLRRYGIDYVEFPMDAIYSEERYVTHFNKALDSYRIYSALLRFAGSPITAAALSCVIYLAFEAKLTFQWLPELGAAAVLAGWLFMLLSIPKNHKGYALLAALGAALAAALLIAMLTALAGFTAVASWWIAALPLAVLSYSLWLNIRHGRKPHRIKEARNRND